jgi:hypothetical protein
MIWEQKTLGYLLELMSGDRKLQKSGYKMTEMKIIPGRHSDGTVMDMRITEVREDDKDPKSKILAWMIYGYNKKKNEVLMLDMFKQSEKPIRDVDFTIYYNLKAKENEGKR